MKSFWANINQQLNQAWANKNYDINIVCTNRVDMLRWRILFHENLKPLTLFGLKFTTLSNWYGKASSEIYATLDRRPVSRNQFNLLQAIAIEELQGKRIDKAFLLNLKGNQRLLYSIGKALALHNMGLVERSIPEPFITVLKDIQEKIKFNRLDFEANLIRDFSPKKVQEKPLAIFLFPTLLSLEDRMFFNANNKLYQPRWYIHTFSDQFNATAGEIIRYSETTMAKKSYRTWLRDGTNFSAKSVKLFRAENLYAEASLVARQVMHLVDGYYTHNVQVLYANHKIINYLVHAMRDFQIPIDLQMPQPKNRSFAGFVTRYLDLLRLGLSGGTIYSLSNFFAFLRHPLLNLQKIHNKKSFKAKHIAALEKYLKTFSYLEVADLNEMYLFASGKEEGGTKFQYLRSVFLSIISNLKCFTEEFKSCRNIIELNEAFRKNLSEILSLENLNDSYKHIIEQGINRLRLKLKELETLRDIESSSLNKHYFKLIRENVMSLQEPLVFNQEKRFYESTKRQHIAGVTIRHISEGIHSSSKHLIICGLNTFSFPIVDRQPLIDTELTLSLTADQQIASFLANTSLISDSIFISYPMNEEPNVSVLAYKIIAQQHGLTVNKKLLVDNLPIYRHIPGSMPEWLNTKGAKIKNWSEQFTALENLLNNKTTTLLRNPKIDDQLEDQLQLYEDILSERLNQHHDFGAYSGIVKDSSATEKVFRKHTSVSRIEQLANCPQRFWFHSVLGLKQITEPREHWSLQKFEEGTLFHTAAQRFIQVLIEEFESLPYAMIFKKIDVNDLQERLKQSFTEAEAKIRKKSTAFVELIVDSQIDLARHQFFQYFESFSDLCKRQSHILDKYMPLYTEKKFEKIHIGPFRFSGSVDRVDYNPLTEELLIIDYKTSEYVQNIESFDDIRYLQLPVYMSAIAIVLKAENPDIQIKKVTGCYSYIKSGGTGQELLPRPFQNFEFKAITSQDALPDLLRGLNIVKALIDKGNFFAFPRKKGKVWQAPCNFCEYQSACDRNPYHIAGSRLERSEIAKEYFTYHRE